MLLRLIAQLYIALILIGAPLASAWAFGRGSWPAWALAAVLAAQFAVCALVVALRWINPPTTAFKLRVWRERRAAGLDTHLEQTWAPLSALSPELLLAAIAGEDAYFARHAGFDFGALRLALTYNRTGAPKKKRGGSTISQQLAKNLFLWQGQNVVRKALETYLTLLLEAAWPKRRILEVYLNVVQFGPQTFGAQAAAQRFFNKPALTLTRPEAALLIASLPNPTVFLVEQPGRYMRYRQLLIVGSMKKLGPLYESWLEAWPTA